MQYIIPCLRCHWPEVEITVRADSAYARNDIMDWCEAENVDYVIAMATNERLVRMSKDIEAKAKAEFERCQTVDPPLELEPLGIAPSTIGPITPGAKEDGSLPRSPMTKKVCIIGLWSPLFRHQR